MAHLLDKPGSQQVVAPNKLVVEVAGSKPSLASAEHTVAVHIVWAVRRAAAAS